MKTARIIFSVLALFWYASSQVTAQSCAAFFPFEKGATMEYTSYDSKAKMQSLMAQTVVIIDDDGAEGLTAQVEATIKDKKGEDVMKNTYYVTCKNDTLYMDVNAQMPQLTEAFSTMEITMTGKQLAIPTKLTPGQTLPDANMEIQAASGGMNLLKMNIDVVERKVEGKESLTTPAGTFECYKISQMTNTKMLVGKSFKTVSWYTEKIGLIKTESYDKKGNLESYMVLTKFSKE